jgi:hypothetical protein
MRSPQFNSKRKVLPPEGGWAAWSVLVFPLLLVSFTVQAQTSIATPSKEFASSSTAQAVRPKLMGSWHTEVVDSIPGHEVGAFSSMVIDGQGNFHIAHVDATQRTLRYAYRGKGDKKWFTLGLGPGSGVTSLAVDNAGRPHISYVAQFGGGLRYTTWDGKKWHDQLVDPERIEFFTSIQLDSQGHPKISYYHRSYPDGSYALRLKYAYFDGQTWFTQTVDGRFGTGKFNSLALDASGNPHIAYSDTEHFSLRYTHWDGSRWLFGSPDPGNGAWVGAANSIVVDATGLPSIAYMDAANRRLKYVHRNGDHWDIEVVDQLVGRMMDIDRVSLKLDSHNRSHIAYYDSGLGELKYATRTDKGWQTEVVDHSGNVGLYASLCFTETDEPYISYVDVSNGVLRVAYRNNHPASAKSEQTDEAR